MCPSSVFRKATHTNQYLSFDSHHPVAHKAAVVRTLMHRASTLSSNSVKRVTEEKKVMKAVRANGYPSGFIHRHSDNRTPRWTEDDQRLPRTSLTLPYIGGLSEAVRRVLRPLDIKVAFHPLRTLRHQLVCPKDPAPRDQRAGVVYQIPSSDWPKMYIGQSGRTLKHQFSEHKMWLHLLWQSTHGPLAAMWTYQRLKSSCPTLCDHTVSPGALAHPTPPTHV